MPDYIVYRKNYYKVHCLEVYTRSELNMTDSLLQAGQVIDHAVQIPAPIVKSLLQGDQLNMAVFFWYLVQNDLSSVCSCTRVHWSSDFLHGTRKTRPCLTDNSLQSDNCPLHLYELTMTNTGGVMSAIQGTEMEGSLYQIVGNRKNNLKNEDYKYYFEERHHRNRP